MIRIRSLTLRPGEREGRLKALAAKALHLPQRDILTLTLHRRSIDARKKPEVRIVYTVDVCVRGDEAAVLRKARCKNAEIAHETFYAPPVARRFPAERPVVVGFGPAGIFAALLLAEAGLRPIVLERGDDAKTRTEKVRAFWAGGKLDPESNVQFGEGGAGAFSDGKLNTGTHDARIRWVLRQLADAGAGEDICIDAKPHVGTDVLVRVIQSLRARIVSLGGEVRFGTKMTGLVLESGRVTALDTSAGCIPCSSVILALGHSARDTVRTLFTQGLPMEPKAFSMGVRIEHSQKAIDLAQYGAEDPHLPAADYKLSVHLPDGQSAYTFCMCPGGYVVAAASEEGGVVTNGMSYSGRSGENANSALLVTLTPEDFPAGDDPLRGMDWQRSVEQAAYRVGGGDYHAPSQTVGSFLGLKREKPPIAATYQPGVREADLREVLPGKVTDVIARALPELDRRLHGFAAPEARMTAPETRSSSPVRIVRDEALQSPAARGVFPCGEGAGYAGGIVSAAVDGLRCAEALIRAME